MTFSRAEAAECTQSQWEVWGADRSPSSDLVSYRTPTHSSLSLPVRRSISSLRRPTDSQTALTPSRSCRSRWEGVEGASSGLPVNRTVRCRRRARTFPTGRRCVRWRLQGGGWTWRWTWTLAFPTLFLSDPRIWLPCCSLCGHLGFHFGYFHGCFLVDLRTHRCCCQARLKRGRKEGGASSVLSSTLLTPCRKTQQKLQRFVCWCLFVCVDPRWRKWRPWPRSRWTAPASPAWTPPSPSSWSEDRIATPGWMFPRWQTFSHPPLRLLLVRLRSQRGNLPPSTHSDFSVAAGDSSTEMKTSCFEDQTPASAVQANRGWILRQPAAHDWATPWVWSVCFVWLAELNPVCGTPALVSADFWSKVWTWLCGHDWDQRGPTGQPIRSAGDSVEDLISGEGGARSHWANPEPALWAAPPWYLVSRQHRTPPSVTGYSAWGGRPCSLVVASPSPWRWFDWQLRVHLRGRNARLG